jgi:hypothetical protein
MNIVPVLCWDCYIYMGAQGAEDNKDKDSSRLGHIHMQCDKTDLGQS